MASLSKSVLVLAALLAATPALAQDPHHPTAAAPAPSAAPMPGQPPQGQPGMPGMAPGSAPGAPMGGMMQMMEMMGRGDMMGGMMPHGGMMPMPAMMGMADHAEGWLGFFNAELKITDTQTAQWNKFAEAVRANAKAMAEKRAAMMMPSPAAAPSSLPVRLAASEKALAGQLEVVQRLKTAIDPLYATLSEQQKKTFDELTASPRGMM